MHLMLQPHRLTSLFLGLALDVVFAPTVSDFSAPSPLPEKEFLLVFLAQARGTLWWSCPCFLSSSTGSGTQLVFAE